MIIGRLIAALLLLPPSFIILAVLRPPDCDCFVLLSVLAALLPAGIICLLIFRLFSEWRLAKYGESIIGKVLFEGVDGAWGHGSINLLVYDFQPGSTIRRVTRMIRRYPRHIIFGEGNPILLYYFPKDWNSARPSEILMFRRVGCTERTSVNED